MSKRLPGICVCVLGLVAAGYGFYEISLYNPDPPRWFGIYLFGVGLLIALVGLLWSLASDLSGFFGGRPTGI